jgi:hypothetical protein
MLVRLKRLVASNSCRREYPELVYSVSAQHIVCSSDCTNIELIWHSKAHVDDNLFSGYSQMHKDTHLYFTLDFSDADCGRALDV